MNKLITIMAINKWITITTIIRIRNKDKNKDNNKETNNYHNKYHQYHNMIMIIFNYKEHHHKSYPITITIIVVDNHHLYYPNHPLHLITRRKENSNKLSKTIAIVIKTIVKPITTKNHHKHHNQ